MGDIIMSTPAFHALKTTFNCRLTLLTSSAGVGICKHIPDIEEVIIADLPWMKLNVDENSFHLRDLIHQLKTKQFDAAIIFTVYSQSSLPAALLTFMAGIPERIAYCRENPYHLLTTWVPDKEPYSFIQHQTERDLQLAEAVGAVSNDKHLQLLTDASASYSLQKKLHAHHFSVNDDYIIIHAGVSEKKREYPIHLWQQLVQQLQQQSHLKIVFTGTKEQKNLIAQIITQSQQNIINLAGKLSISELIALTEHARLMITVNTVTAHIAAALQTPVIVLYALTNPQHTPWMVKHEVFYFPVNEEMQSRNEVIRYVSDNWKHHVTEYPKTSDIIQSVKRMLQSDSENETLA